MKIQVTLDIEDIKSQLTPENAYEIISCFEDDVIMNALEKIDHERGDWIILDRTVNMVRMLSKDLKNEIEEAIEGGHINNETYEFLRRVK